VHLAIFTYIANVDLLLVEMQLLLSWNCNYVR